MTSDPLAIVEAWPSEVPLITLEQALEQSLLQSGLSRQDYIKRLVQDLHKPRLQPLLWLLPRRWRLAPAQLPQQLHGLAQLLERGLLTPSLLAVLGDEMAQWLPQPDQATTPLERWRGAGESSLKPWSEVVPLARAMRQLMPQVLRPKPAIWHLGWCGTTWGCITARTRCAARPTAQPRNG